MVSVCAELPFANLANDDLVDFFSLEPNIDVDSHMNIIFNPSEAYEKFTNTFDPDQNIRYFSKAKCEYFHMCDLVDEIDFKKGLSLMSYNIRSMSKNFESFENEFDLSQFEIVGLCEAQLNHEMQSLYRLP